jgi:hypothetical protein
MKPFFLLISSLLPIVFAISCADTIVTNGTTQPYIYPEGDVDYFTFDIAKSGNYRIVSLPCVTALCKLAFTLYNQNKMQISSWQTPNDFSLSQTVALPIGFYYLRIAGASKDDASSSTIRISIESSDSVGANTL